MTVTRSSQIILDPVNEVSLPLSDSEYQILMNNFSVNAPDDGWLKVKLTAVDVDAPGESYYYDSATSELKNTSGDVISPSVVFADINSVVAEVNFLKTSLLDQKIANILAEYTKLKIRGMCPDEDEWRKHIQFLQTGRTAAKVQFDTYGQFFNAAFILDSLEQYITVNDLDE